MTTLLLMRHAPAEAGRPADSDRKLLNRGEKVAIRMAHFLRASIPPEAILSSPFTRAKQTADIIAEELGITASFSKNLEPYGTIAAAMNDIRAGLRTSNPLLVITHQPLLDEVGLTVLQLDGEAPVLFKQGSIARMDIAENKDAYLRWLVTPKLVARMKKL